jgi:hypothetical protein
MTLKVNKKGLDSGNISSKKNNDSNKKNLSFGPSKKPFRIKQKFNRIES